MPRNPNVVLSKDGKTTKGIPRKPFDKNGHVNNQGAPRKINIEDLERVAMLICTKQELAVHFNVSVDTLEEPLYAEAIKRGESKGKESLRRMQWKTAMAGNPSMQMFLGKVILRQRENDPETVRPSDINELNELANNATAPPDDA